MESPIYVRVTELSRIAGVAKATVSAVVRGGDREGLEITGNRLVGIAPEVVQRYMMQRGLERLYKSSLIVFATQTGGSGKTSGTLNTAIAARRMTDRKQAIVMVDCDSQASLSLQAFGEPAPDDAPTLVEWIEDKCSLDEILSPLDNNTWIIRSNLNSIYLDRALSKHSSIKSRGLKLMQEILARFGAGAKVFVDTPPQLSAISQSFVCAIGQGQDFDGYLMIPVRADLFGVKGARICLNESFEVLDTFGLDKKKLNVSVFLSSYDQRTKTSVRTLTLLTRDEVLAEYMAPVAIRHSSEVTKAGYRHGNVFNDYKNANSIGADYTELLLTTMGWQRKGE